MAKYGPGGGVGKPDKNGGLCGSTQTVGHVLPVSRAGGDTPVSHRLCLRRTCTPLLLLLWHFLPFFWGALTGWGRTEIHFHMVQQHSYIWFWARTTMTNSVWLKTPTSQLLPRLLMTHWKNRVFLSTIIYRNDTRTTMRTLWVAQYRFFFFFFDFFFSRRGDGEGLSELLTEGMRVSDLRLHGQEHFCLCSFSHLSLFLFFFFFLRLRFLGGESASSESSTSLREQRQQTLSQGQKWSWLMTGNVTQL